MTTTSFLHAALSSHGVRLHLWLEDGEGEGFGVGRMELLRGIHRLGSLNRAAKELGMSYRGAWGKVRKAEQLVGVPLVENCGAKRDGCRLTAEGQKLIAFFDLWRNEVALFAARRAAELLDCADETSARETGAKSAE